MSTPDEEQSGLLSLIASLKVTLGGLKDSIDRRNQQKAADAMRLNSLVPVDEFVVGNGVIPSGATTVSFAIGHPQQGRIKVLRAVRVSGPGWDDSVTGTARLVQSPTDPLATGTTVRGAQVVDQVNALPNPAFYSSRYIVLKYPDRLWMVIVGGTALQQYVANAEWEDYEDGGYKSRVTL